VRRSLALCLFIIFGLAAPAMAAGDDPLKTAAQLAKDNRYAEAQAIFQKLVDTGNPKRLGEILIARAEAYFAASEYDRAAAALSAAQALPLSDALRARAAALGDKIGDKLSWRRLKGSITVSAIHDSRLRHRVRVVSSGNGVEIIEICDDEPGGFDDYDGGPAIGSYENCYFEEVTDDAQARSATVNIPDWQMQTVDKVEHQLPLDGHGSYWRTIGELTQGWHFEAADQNNRVIKARSGPSWFFPDWQTRFDLNATYLSGRQNHVTNLQYLAPLAALEWRAYPALKFDASYQYQKRWAYPSQGNGNAHVVDAQLHWEPTAVDRLTVRGLLRQQAAQFAYNSYNSEELRAGYRRGFRWWFGLEGGFVEAELRARFTNFNGPAPSDNTEVRHDTIPSGLIYLGQEFDKTWTVKLSCSYNEVDSTIPRYVRNDFQYYLAVTRNF
jgi:hypothetical protein